MVLSQESADTSRDFEMLPLVCPRFLMDIEKQKRMWPVLQTALSLLKQGTVSVLESCLVSG